MSVEFDCKVCNPLDMGKLLLEFAQLCKEANIVPEKPPAAVSRSEPVVELPMPRKLDVHLDDETRTVILQLQPDTEFFVMIYSLSKDDPEVWISISFPQRNPPSFLVALLMTTAVARLYNTTVCDDSILLGLGVDVTREQVMKLVSQPEPMPFLEAARLVGKRTRLWPET